MKRETTATFIGHNECYGVSKTDLQNEIKKLIEMGVTDFISGGQGGFDRLSARCVYELKTKYPSIQNHLVIPYLSLYYRVVVIISSVWFVYLYSKIIYPISYRE